MKGRFALVAAGVCLAAVAQGEPIAIEHGRVFPVEGPPIEDGTVVTDGGTITAIGPAASVKVPDDAVRIDARGAWVTPGLFDAESRLGLLEISLEPSTKNAGLDGRYDAVRAAFQAVDAWNPTSVVIPVTRIEGITTVQIAPEGGLVAGRGAVMRLGGRGTEAMTMATPSAMYGDFGTAARDAGYGSRGGAMLRWRELLDDVRQYAKRRQDFEKNQMRKVVASRLDLEALIPVVEGKLPLVLETHAAADIQAALRFARDERIKIVLSGVSEGWRVAPEIAAAGVPVIVHPLSNLPEAFDRLGERLDNAALLHKAGVKLAISTLAGEPHNSRTIKQEAGNAVAQGLPWDEALRAVTRAPAEMFGVGDRVGTLAPGKEANVVVWSGDPFETSTRVRAVIVRGENLPLVSRQTELRDRYRDLSKLRPRP